MLSIGVSETAGQCLRTSFRRGVYICFLFDDEKFSDNVDEENAHVERSSTTFLAVARTREAEYYTYHKSIGAVIFGKVSILIAMYEAAALL